MPYPNDQNGASRSHRSRDRRPFQSDPQTQPSGFSRAQARALFERELAYYRADEPYLSVQKCAERCAKLSVLLTAALDTPPRSALH